MTDRKIVCWDVETHLFVSGNRAPKPVVVGVYGDGVPSQVILVDDFVPLLSDWLSDDNILMVNANPAYDFAVMMAHYPHVATSIFAAYRDNRVACCQMLTQLYDIATIGTNKTHTYNLAALADRWLGKTLVKDTWRKRYAELDGVPLDQYPADALTYVKDDAIAAYDVWQHVHTLADQTDVPVDDVYAQSRAQLALFLTTCAGMYTDPVYVDNIRTFIQDFQARAKPILLDAGLIRHDVGNVIWDIWEEVRRDAKAHKAYLTSRGLSANCKDIRARETRPGTKRILQAWSDKDMATLKRAGLTKTITRRTNTGKRVVLDKLIASDAKARERAINAPRIIAHVDLPKTKTGLVSVTDELLKFVDDGILADFIEWKRLKSMYAEVEKLAKGVYTPIHGEFRTLKETGRTSSGGGEAGLNMQNRRRAYGSREAFIPEKGHLFVSIDYTQAELCALAQVQLAWFGRSALADVINAGRDCHLYMAAQLAGKSYDDIAKLYYAGDLTARTLRDLAKALMFGLPGGLGEVTIRQFARETYGVIIAETKWSMTPQDGYVPLTRDQMPSSVFVAHLPNDLQRKAKAQTRTGYDGQVQSIVFVSPDGAERVAGWWLANQGNGQVYVLERSYAHLRAMWEIAYPEMPLYFARIKDMRQTNDDTIVQYKSGRQRADTTFCGAANTFFQGLVGDCIKDAHFRIAEQMYTPGNTLSGCKVVNNVHDELIIQVPIGRHTTCAQAATDIMLDAAKYYMPDVKVKAEPALMRRWTKAACTRWVGRELVPEEDWQLVHGQLTDERRQDLLAFFARHELQPMV